ncbi:hypothetical protein E3E12_02165 [Formicincola oecophyllae]|uniref:Uncharacterized protein n=1 Tax=Formicincola oecophyllae TaxID=2558361 RepID=A0A4Y6U9G8_9PROT|nr:hypothetical protein [Formicincola oecophyllae]QDH13198.1 hypothetical protein E3E12_02165 [Formicincola oecophyllae]
MPGVQDKTPAPSKATNPHQPGLLGEVQGALPPDGEAVYARKPLILHGHGDAVMAALRARCQHVTYNQGAWRYVADTLTPKAADLSPAMVYEGHSPLTGTKSSLLLETSPDGTRLHYSGLCQTAPLLLWLTDGSHLDLNPIRCRPGAGLVAGKGLALHEVPLVVQTERTCMVLGTVDRANWQVFKPYWQVLAQRAQARHGTVTAQAALPSSNPGEMGQALQRLDEGRRNSSVDMAKAAQHTMDEAETAQAALEKRLAHP